MTEAVAPTAAPTESAPAPEAVAETPVSTPKVKKYKVNGREMEVDLSDESKLDSYIQKGLGADERFREAKKMMDQLENRFGKIPEWQKHPFFKVIDEGADPYEVAEQLLLQKIDWEEMSDEQRELHMTRRERDELKKHREELEAKEQEQRRQTQRAQAVKEIDEDITSAVKELGKKPTPRLIARIAEQMMAEQEAQLAPLIRKYGTIDAIPDDEFATVGSAKAKSSVNKVYKEYLSDITELLGNMTPEEAAKVLPPELVDGLRKLGVKNVLSQDPHGSRKQSDPTRPTQLRKPEKKRMSSDEFFANLSKKLG